MTIEWELYVFRWIYSFLKLKGNELNKEKAHPVELILRKNKRDAKYSVMIQAGEVELEKYIDKIQNLH